MVKRSLSNDQKLFDVVTILCTLFDPYITKLLKSISLFPVGFSTYEAVLIGAEKFSFIQNLY